MGIFFSKDNELNLIVRKIKEIKWSQTHKCWYLPLNESSYKIIHETFESQTSLDAGELKAYLNKRKAVQSAALPSGHAKKEYKPVIASPAWKLSKENLEELRKFIEHLKLKAYSTSTIKTYRGEFLQLLQLLKKKPVHELTPDDLRRYMIYCFEKLHLSENTLHSRINAIKFYFEQVLKREKFFWEIPRPKKPVNLPRLLNEWELAKLFNALTNKKHKAMLFTAYSAGLRVSEIVNLQLKDIDSKRMQIFVRCAKGKKDRYVNLSPVLLDILRQYVSSYQPAPRFYLFESEQTKVLIPPERYNKSFRMQKRKRASEKM